jgi:CHAT domain-containing protein
MWRAIVRRWFLSEASGVVKLGPNGVGGGDEFLLDFLTEQASDAVEALRALVTDTRGRFDVRVAEALALLHWHRFWLVDDCDELPDAVDLFQRLGPERSPAVLAPLFDRDPGELSDTDVMLLAVTASYLDDERTMPLARYLRKIQGTLPPDVDTDVATALLTAYQRDEDDTSLLDAAERHVRAALAGTEADDEDWLDRAGLLGHVLAERGDEPSLREALDLLRGPLETVNPDHPDLVRAVTALFRATSVHLAGNWSGQVLAEAVPALRRLADLLPDWDDLQAVARIAETSLLVFRGDLDGARWLAATMQEGPDAPDADRARLLRAVLSPGARPTPDLLCDLEPQDVVFGTALFGWLHAVAPDVFPPPTAIDDMPALVHWAEILFAYSSEQGGEHRERAIELIQRARSIGGDLAPGVRSDLAGALTTAYDYVPDGGILDDAIAHARAAVAATPPEDTTWLARAAVLGQALITAGDARSDSGLVREALDLLRPAVEHAPRGHPDWSDAAAVMAGGVSVHLSQNWGGTVLIDTAAELRHLLELIADEFTERDTFIGIALMAEIHHLIGVGDLSAAVALGPELDAVIARAAPGTPGHDRLAVTRASLAVLRYLARFEPAPAAELAAYRDLVRGVSSLDLPERVAHLEGLGAILAGQAELTGDRDLLDSCVALMTEEMGVMPEGSVERRTVAATLGSALMVRFIEGRDRADLDQAIALLRQRPAGSPGNVWEQSGALSELGHALAERHRVTGDDADYDESWRLLNASSADARFVLMPRLYDAYAAGRLAGRKGRWDDAAAILADAVAMASDLAWHGLGRADRQANLASQLAWPEWMRRAGRDMPRSGMVNEAAAASVRAGDAARAVELLDEGRAILLHQALDTRAGITGVEAGLTARLDALQREIGGASDPRRRHEAAREWDRLVAGIRSRPGFERFLRAPGLAALLPGPGQTAVLVNPADFGSDAFVVTAAGVRVVPLPLLRTDDVRDRVAAFRRALVDRSRATIDDVLDWLWRTIAEPVLDTLPDGTHVHWCPTAMLTFLPLHAAARHPSELGRSVLDRVVSSYALSLRTLRHTSRRPDPPSGRRSLLVVAMPDTPGLPALPGARREAATLAGLPVRTQVLAGEGAVRASVSQAVLEHAWAHFACHAGQDLHDPSAGRLYLHDGQLTVADLSKLRLDDAQFAYLSACDTARGGLRLPDEALHLGGALQLAGYQHVIATQWPISDRIAATMTERVYARLRTADGLDLSRAAPALHDAVRALRERYPQNPALWASYVHFGP